MSTTYRQPTTKLVPLRPPTPAGLETARAEMERKQTPNTQELKRAATSRHSSGNQSRVRDDQQYTSSHTVTPATISGVSTEYNRRLELGLLPLQTNRVKLQTL